MKRKNRRIFSNEFKREACRMVLEEKQKISETAKDLGIGEGLLGKWVRAERHELLNPGSRAENQKLKELESENRKLRMERDILKKAMAYFVVEPK